MALGSLSFFMQFLKFILQSLRGPMMPRKIEPCLLFSICRIPLPPSITQLVKFPGIGYIGEKYPVSPLISAVFIRSGFECVPSFCGHLLFMHWLDHIDTPVMAFLPQYPEKHHQLTECYYLRLCRYSHLTLQPKELNIFLFYN